MKYRSALIAILFAIPLMGVKGCSDCEKLQAVATGVCAQFGEDSEACKQAKAEAASKCVPETPPTPPPATCADGLPPGPDGCPKTCSDLACAYGCDQPNPHEDAVCRPKPAEPPPQPPPAACAVEEDLVAFPAPGPQLQAQVERAIAELGPATGIEPRVSLEKLAAKLRSYGLCAIAGIEAVFVQRADGLFEEYHAVYFGDGSWTNSGKGRYIGTHRKAGDSEPVSACPSPVPPRLWTSKTLPDGWSADLIGKPRFEIRAKAHNSVVDSTPVESPRACDYCASIGMGELSPGVPRCGCPVRPDGHPDRVACEDVLLLPPSGRHGPMWTLDGSSAELPACGPESEGPCVTDNPFQAKSAGQAVRACSWDLDVCSPAVSN